MNPRDFLAFAREAYVGPENENGIYVVYEQGEPFMHGKRIPELEEQLGSGSLVFCTDVLETQDSVFNLYFHQNETTYAVEIFVFPEEQEIGIYALEKTINETWGVIERKLLQCEIQRVIKYIREQPRFRLYFLTGNVKIDL